MSRASIRKAFEDLAVDMKTGGGVSALPASEQNAANEFFDHIQQYGLFAVRKGEDENWLPGPNVIGKKTDWTVAMLERLGSDPLSRSYVKPAEDDVWEFIRDIIAWVKNTRRKGT